MQFKDLKPGYQVYIFVKGNELKAMTGKVINVSQPYFPQQQPGQIASMQTAQRVVDVTVEADGKTSTYSIPETLSVTYANNLVLSTDREGILRDVEAMKIQSQEIVNSYDKHNAIINNCDKILEEWNPAFAEKKAQDTRITSIESEVKGMKKMLSDFINEFKK